MSEAKRTIVAKVRKPHGIKGGLKVQVYDLDLGEFEKLPKLFVNLDSQWKTVHIDRIEGNESNTILLLKEVKTRNQSEEYRELSLYAEVDDLPDDDENQYFIDDLIGTDVYNTKSTLIGKVEDVISHNAHDVFIIKTLASEELLVPFVSEWVIEVNIDENKIIINEADEV